MSKQIREYSDDKAIGNIGAMVMEKLNAGGSLDPKGKTAKKSTGNGNNGKDNGSHKPQASAAFSAPKLRAWRSRLKETKTEQPSMDIEEINGIMAESVAEIFRLRSTAENRSVSLELNTEDFVSELIDKGIFKINDRVERFTSVLALGKALVAGRPTEGRHVGREARWVVDLLSGKLGVFEKSDKDNKDTVQLYGGYYCVSKTYQSFTDAKHLLRSAAAMVKSAVQYGRDTYQNDEAELKRQAGDNCLTLSGLKDKQAGNLLLKLDDYMAGEYKKRGGVVLVQFEPSDVESHGGGILTPIGAVGGPKKDFQEAIDRNLNMSLAELRLKKFDPTERISPKERFWAARNLHTVLREALLQAQDQEDKRANSDAFKAQADQEREELKALVTLTSDQFHNSQVDGSYLVDPNGHGPYLVVLMKDGKQVKDEVKSERCRKFVARRVPASKDAFDVFFLAKREGGKVSYECPDRLKKFFEQFPVAVDNLIKADKRRAEKEAQGSSEARRMEAESRREQKATEFDQSFEAEMLAADDSGEAEVTAAVETVAEAEVAPEAKPKSKRGGRKAGGSKTKKSAK